MPLSAASLLNQTRPHFRKLLRLLAKPQTQVIGLTLGIALSITIFVLWIWLTVVPILVVETKYQLYKTMDRLLGTTSVRELFTPDFSFLDLEGMTEHRDYGIVIPDVFVDEAVVFNVDPNSSIEYTQALKQGIAHASGTAFPDNGGLGYYFAHSTSPEFRNQFKAVFYLLGKLKPSQKVYIWFDSRRYEYKVVSVRVTQPEDTAFLKEEYSQETIVLQTCWPPGTTKERLLVFAERVK